MLAGTGGGYFMIARLDLPNVAMIVPVVMLLAGVVRHGSGELQPSGVCPRFRGSR